MIYKLVSSTGQTLKHGITKQAIGAGRYTKGYLDSIGARFQPVLENIYGRAVGYAIEKGYIKGQFKTNGDVLSPLNKGFR